MLVTRTQQDDAAATTPAGEHGMLVARAEGAGFPTVTAGDGVASQGTVSGVPLHGISAPDGTRFADVDAEDDVAPADPRGLYGVAVARNAGSGPGVANLDAVALSASTGGVQYQVPASGDLARVADVVTEDAVAPTDPTGLFQVAVAANAGSGAGVANLDVVSPRSSTGGVAYSLPASGDLARVADVETEDAAAAANPTGLYSMGVAIAAGSGAAVANGDTVAIRTGVGGALLSTPSSADAARFADVDTEDAASPANPTGQYPVAVALAEGGAGAGVAAADTVALRASTDGVLFHALTDGAGSRVADVDAENEPAPAAPRGAYAGGRATTASPAFTNGDYTPLNFDLSARLRMVDAGPGVGHDAIHSTGTSAALGAGANTVTAYTVSASRFFQLKSCICRYTGTVAGVTLQLQVGSVRADIAIGGLISGVDVDLLAAGRIVDADAAETVQILVTGATATDTITWSLHGDELTA